MAKFRLQRKESQAEFRKILLETRKSRECSRWKDGVLWNNLSMTCELLQNRKNIPSAPIPVLLSLKAAFSWGKSQSSRSLFLVTRGCGWGGGVLLDPRQFSIHHRGLLNWILYFGYEFHRHYVLVLSPPQNVKANNGEKCGFSDLARSDQNSVLQLGGLGPHSPHLGNGMVALEESVRSGELIPMSTQWLRVSYIFIMRTKSRHLQGFGGLGLGSRVDTISPMSLYQA